MTKTYKKELEQISETAMAEHEEIRSITLSLKDGSMDVKTFNTKLKEFRKSVRSTDKKLREISKK